MNCVILRGIRVLSKEKVDPSPLAIAKFTIIMCLIYRFVDIQLRTLTSSTGALEYWMGEGHLRIQNSWEVAMLCFSQGSTDQTTLGLGGRGRNQLCLNAIHTQMCHLQSREHTAYA